MLAVDPICLKNTLQANVAYKGIVLRKILGNHLHYVYRQTLICQAFPCSKVHSTKFGVSQPTGTDAAQSQEDDTCLVELSLLDVIDEDVDLGWVLVCGLALLGVFFFNAIKKFVVPDTTFFGWCTQLELITEQHNVFLGFNFKLITEQQMSSSSSSLKSSIADEDSTVCASAGCGHS